MSKLTIKQAVEQNCFDCTYDPLDVGSKHQQTENCTITTCALWEFRPVTGATKKNRHAEKLEAMTPEQRRAYDLRTQEAAERFRAMHASK